MTATDIPAVVQPYTVCHRNKTTPPPVKHSNTKVETILNQQPTQHESATTNRLETILIVFIITIWLIFGVTINIINKWIFSEMHFQYPLFLASWQMLLSFVTNAILLSFSPLKQYHKPPSESLRKRILVLSIVFSSALALGNIGLKYIHVSFHKVLYATAPAVTVVLSTNFTGRQFSRATYTSLIPLCCGTMLCVLGEGTDFHWLGFLCTSVSVVLAGLKSLIQGLVLQDGDLSSFSLLYQMALPSFVFLSLGVCVIERDLFGQDLELLLAPGLQLAVLVSCLNGIMYNLTTYTITYYTSPVTVRVLGNMSTVLNVAVSTSVFGNTLSNTSVLGLLSTVVGGVLYHRSMKHN